MIGIVSTIFTCDSMQYQGSWTD